MRDIAYIEGKIANIAATQQGNVTRAQLLELGLGSTSIGHRIKSGRLHRVHRGVYAVGRPPIRGIERAAAAVLACGPRAVLSHGSAMTLWGFWERWDDPLEVTVASDRAPSGIRIHRSFTLLRRDVATIDGVRVTGAARTLLDVAPRLRTNSLVRVINEARRAGFLTLGDLAEVAARCWTHPGAPLLRAQANNHQNPTRSSMEDDFQAFCRRFDLPMPEINAVVCGYEVDAYFREEKLIVELDGWGFHSDRQAFERDRERDATMLMHGIATIRITYGRLHGSPELEARRLHAILASRRPGRDR